MKSIFTFIVFMTLVLSISFQTKSAAANTKPSARKIKANTKIEIFEYLKESDLFVVEITTEPAVGPNYAAPDQLAKSIGLEVKGSTLSKKNADYVGAQFVLKSELPLVNEADIQKRKKK